MSDSTVVEHMITFIEQKERKLQSDKLANDSQAKNDIVKSILDELEREMSK